MRACTDRLSFPWPPPMSCVVSSSTYLFGCKDHGAVTASSGKVSTNECRGGHSAEVAARRPAKKIAKLQKAFSCFRTVQQAIESDRPDPFLGSYRQVRTHRMMQDKGHLFANFHMLWFRQSFATPQNPPRTDSNAHST